MIVYNLDLVPCKLTSHSKGRIAYGVIYDPATPNKRIPCIAYTSYEDILVSKIKDDSIYIYKISGDGGTYEVGRTTCDGTYFSYFVVPCKIDISCRELTFWENEYSDDLKKMIEEEYKPFLNGYSITIGKNK